MTDGLKVNHAELEAAAAQMQQTVNKMSNTLEELDRDIAPKVATWSGGQQQAYQAAKTTWNNALTEMINLLGEAKNSVDNSNQDYAAADRRGASRFEF